MDPTDIKTNVDKEYAAKPHGGSKTPWIIAAVAVTLILLFGAALLIYFLVFNKPAMHEIIVVNNSGVPINVIFGGTLSSNDGTIKYLPTRQIASGQSFTYKSTPGVTIFVQGYRNGDIVASDSINPFTTVGLLLAGNKFTGNPEITDGSAIVNGLETNTSAIDEYGVSVQGGYNLPVTIRATNNFQTGNINTKFACVGPTWNRAIPGTGTVGIACPPILRYPGGTGGYQVCLAACGATGVPDPVYCCGDTGACGISGGCEASWPNQNYYNVFAGACPNCLITNCDLPNYQCESADGLSQYTINFLSFT